MWNLPVGYDKSETNQQHSAESYSQSRSFHFNEIYYGLSKQILLELRIPKYELKSCWLTLNESDTSNSQEIKKPVLKARGQLLAKDSKGTLIEKTIFLSTSLVFPEEDLPSDSNIHNEEVEVNYLRV